MSKKAKTKNPRTYVAIVLDKSSSMMGTKTETIEGYNEQVEQMQLNAKEGQDILCSLVTFNGHVYEHLWNVPAAELTKANSEDYTPAGSTAMRDGMGYTIQKLLDTTDHADENNAYLMIVISDGAENSSHQFTPAALKELVSSCENTKRWTFTYMGCGKEVLQQVAQETGIRVENMAMWDNSTSRGTAFGMRSSSERTKKYLSARSKGEALVSNFYSDVKGCCADYTSGEPAEVDLGGIKNPYLPIPKTSDVKPALDLTYRSDLAQVENIVRHERSLNDIYSSLSPYKLNQPSQVGGGVFGKANEVCWNVSNATPTWNTNKVT